MDKEFQHNKRNKRDKRDKEVSKNPESQRIYIRCLIKELRIGNKLLIENSEFNINFKEKVGFIGRNGSGKSTLVKLILSKYHGEELSQDIEFRGEITLPPDLRIAYLPQEIKLQFDGSVSEYLDSVGGEYVKTYKRFKELSSKTELNPEEILEYQNVIEKMTLFDLWDYENRRRVILERLNLNLEILNKNVNEISGGEATKIALAGVLLSDANFWLLDEPTNNLDKESINLLFEEIRKFRGGVLLITHDRKLLSILSKIIEIDEETKMIRTWGGNYLFYRQRKDEEYRARLRKYEEQEKRRKELEESIARLKQKAKRFEEISKNAFYRAKGAKLAGAARAMMERIERELTELTEPKPPERPKFPSPEPEEIRGNILTVENLFYNLGGGRFLKIDYLNIEAGDRLLIEGPNASGKTTFLRIILNEIQPQSGKITLRQNIKIGYLPQTPIIENRNEKVVDYLRRNYNLIEDNIKQILNRMKIPNVFNLEIGDLSIGEIRRVQLAAILANNPQLIILDEPTNHLDVYTVEELVEALKDYKGTIIFVSHDEQFINDIQPNKKITF
jgi:ATPase subunit of ABC transporter with duplicated ATPase domains